jgi:hypothetical protein
MPTRPRGAIAMSVRQRVRFESVCTYCACNFLYLVFFLFHFRPFSLVDDKMTNTVP